MRPRLLISFRRSSEEVFQVKVAYIIAHLTGNAHFPEPWATQVPTVAELTAALENYRALYIESATRDFYKIRARRDARTALADMLGKVAVYLEMVASDDMRKLESTGFDLRTETGRSGVTTGLLEAPADLRISHGRFSGSVNVRVARLQGAASYEVATAPGEGNGVVADWQHATTATAGGRIVIDGYAPGQAIWVRVRGVSSAGPGLWTEPSRLMVV